MYLTRGEAGLAQWLTERKTELVDILQMKKARTPSGTTLSRVLASIISIEHLEQPLNTFLQQRVTSCQKRGRLCDIVVLATREHKIQKVAEGIHNQVNLGAETTFTAVSTTENRFKDH